MHSTLVLSLALAAVSGLVNGDSCVSKDAVVDGSIFEPLRKRLHASDSEFIAFKDFDVALMGLFEVKWTGAKAGNFSSLQLTASTPPKSSSQLCTDTTADTTVKTFTINLDFNDLQADFGSFLIETPVLNIGGDNSAVSLSGENLVVSVQTTTNTKDKTCTVEMKQFQFESWGKLQVKLGGGVLNWVLEEIFNRLASNYVLSILQGFGVGDTINTYVTSYAGTLIDSSGQAELVCALINNV